RERPRFPENCSRIIYRAIKDLRSLGATAVLAGKLTPAPPDIATCMYYAGIDPFTKESGMPLLDHFNPPLNRTHPWRSFHGAWAAAMARLLNQGVLPPGYYAVPLVDSGGPIEIDVAALREQEAAAGGAAGPQTWAPPAPAVAVAVELPIN